MAEYVKQVWKDAVVNEQGKVIEAGTVINKAHMEHIEDGIYDVNVSLTGVVDRGYVVSKPRYDTADANLLRTNGKYVLRGDTTINLPDRGNFYNVDVSDNGDSTYTVQLASCLVNTDNRRVMRHGTGNAWTPWLEIATTETYEMKSSDMRNGWKIPDWSKLKVTRVGNLVNMHGEIFDGAIADNTSLFFIPLGFRPRELTRFKTFDWSNNVNTQYEFFSYTNGDTVLTNTIAWTGVIKQIDMTYTI